MARSRVALIALVVGLVVFGAVWEWGSTDAPPAPQAAPLPTSTTRAPMPTVPATPPSTAPSIEDPGGSNLRMGVARAVKSPALVAEATGSRVPLFSQPGDAEPGDVVDNPTFEGLPVVGLVMERRGDWMEIQISRRPNEATAWVRTADFTLRETPYKIRVDATNHLLTLTDRDKPVMEVSVANGTGGTPTPTGTFFIDGIVKLADPTGPYGTHQLSLAAFSNVLKSFGGGNGQIALHGTNSPDLIGSAVSHGCVRMNNEDITRLADLVGVGTPVEIYE